MNITIYYGNHEDKTIHTMDCHIEIDEEEMTVSTDIQ
ncbi:hypothetical protein J2S09_000903 [Bacillus fengqiuensis]|jgi:hypothetical protein|nr:hypothetical protein [Bacillus fengqiuensis]